MGSYGIWHSPHLLYKAVDAEYDDFLATINDEASYSNAAPFMPAPQGKKSGEGFREWLNTGICQAVICLPPDESKHPDRTAASTTATATTTTTAKSEDDKDPDAKPKPIPVGAICITGTAKNLQHHRKAEIGISIHPDHQRNGYGGEAVQWALQWAFRFGGLHKVKIGHFGYNQGSGRLYERLGFKVEGRMREELWYDGEWWDVIEMGMLESEWRELYGKDLIKGDSARTR